MLSTRLAYPRVRHFGPCHSSNIEERLACIRAFYDGGTYINAWPASVVVGGEYTVRDVDTRLPDCLTIRLEEYLAPDDGSWEIPFLAKNFRPVADKKTDISIFTAILDRERGKPKVIA